MTVPPQLDSSTSLKQPAERLPGEMGIWVFVLGDFVVFGLFFTAYLYYRARDIPLFNQSQRLLDANLGMINTLLLLTSSWLVALGVHAARARRGLRARSLLLIAVVCGVGFIAVKSLEYAHKFQQGITLVTNDYFMYYFMYTGIHLLHVLIGLGVLIVLCRRAPSATPKEMPLFESGAVFWHLVDLLWIMLFTLLYLVA